MTTPHKRAVAYVFGLLLAGHAPAATAAKPRLKVAEGQSARVIEVKDADTLLVRLLPEEKKVKVRVLGIDCPEGPKRNDPQKLGQAAAQIASGLLAGKEIKLESGTGDGKFKVDRFERLLAYIKLADGTDYGLKMIAEGHCGDFGWKHPHPRGAEYGAAEQKASARATQP